jgi:hypothetical protein
VIGRSLRRIGTAGVVQWTDGYRETEGLEARRTAMSGDDGAAWSRSLTEGWLANGSTGSTVHADTSSSGEDDDDDAVQAEAWSALSSGRMRCEWCDDCCAG